MIEKFDIYDVIGAIVPGTIIVLSVPLYFPAVMQLIGVMPPFPEAFVALALTAICFFAGYTLQAIASVIEPVMYWTWGGEAGSRALDRGLGGRYLTKELGNEIRVRLEQVAGKKMSSRSLFFIAMQHAETGDGGRTRRFNAMYAYQRVLTVLAIMALALYIASFANGGLASRLHWQQNVVGIACLSLMTLLFWHRAKQRGFYYVREVLLRANHFLTLPSPGQATDKPKSEKESANGD